MKIEEKCTFCGQSKDNVELLITRDDKSFICSDCIKEMHDYVVKNMDISNTDVKSDDLKTPSQIKQFLDGYVIGQEQAKITLSVAVYNHYKRIRNNANGSEVKLQKSNILMLGPSGSGKTYIVQSIAKCLNVPFAIADATSLTEAGYVGDDVENILVKLLENADYDVEAAQHGIIYIDEIDKIGRKSENVSITKDVGGEGVQQSLLKIIEGSVVSVPPNGGRKHPEAVCVKIDTTDILFICGGAFDGINKLVEGETSGRGIGFLAEVKLNENKDEAHNGIQPRDIIKYGMMPELVGRLPVIITLNALQEEDLFRILTEPKNALVKQYQELLSMDNVALEFTDEALRHIAGLSIKRNLGARGLRAIMEKSMEYIMFTVPDDSTIEKVIIDETVIDGTGVAKIIKKGKKRA